MIISKNNYEAFFLDYHEGNLSDVLKKEVLAFVNSNPDLKEEFESFEIISLSEAMTSFSGKDKLKKNAITEYNYKTWFIAYEENDLSEDDRKEVEKYLESNPGLMPEFEIIRQTKLIPDLDIRFENKSALKKGGVVIPMWVRVAAAACLLIGLISFWMIRENPKPEMVHDHSIHYDIPAGSKEKVLKPENNTVAESNKQQEDKKDAPQKIQKPSMKKVMENKPVENLAVQDTITERDQSFAFQQPVTSGQINKTQETTIVINEHSSIGSEQNTKMVVLNDNDLAELGLKAKEPESKSLLSDAVNGVGKFFGVNAHYEKENRLNQSKYKETLALGPVAITRTVKY